MELAPPTDRRAAIRARRLIALALIILTVGAGLAVHAFLADTPASDIAGDVLYAVAAYLAVVIVAPGMLPLAVGGTAAAWCIGVELLQLTGVPLALGQVFPPAMLVLGTVFDPRDLVVYVLAVAAASVVDIASGGIWDTTRKAPHP